MGRFGSSPLALGGAAPLTQLPWRPRPHSPAMLAALKSTEAMRERAEKMFLSKPDGPHHSDLFTVGMCTPTNSVLEVVQATARWLWVAHEALLKKQCPFVWDEEVARGYLLGDALAQRPADEDTARTLGKRAATQIASVTLKANKAAKTARRGPAEGREAAVAAAVDAVWADTYTTLTKGLDADSIITRFNGGELSHHLPKCAQDLPDERLPDVVPSPATHPTTAAPRPASAAIPPEECSTLLFEESVGPCEPPRLKERRLEEKEKELQAREEELQARAAEFFSDMLAAGNALVDKEDKLEKDYEELDDYKKALDDYKKSTDVWRCRVSEIVKEAKELFRVRENQLDWVAGELGMGPRASVHMLVCSECAASMVNDEVFT